MVENNQKTLDIKLPDWAISDEEVEESLLASGWITDYVKYARTVTDAPLAYHYATAATTLLQALSHIDIRVYTSESDVKSPTARYYELTTPLWTALIGLSGDRKSFAMDLGLDLLRRAVGYSVILPTDGSVEAWTDYIATHQNIVLHREELSFLFSQSKRSYMDGLKDWLLTLHSGRRYDRTTRRRAKATDDKGMEHETGDNEHIIVERPRVTTLGAIPPEVFRTKGDNLDWSSGFFARFMFVPAIRTKYKTSPRKKAEEEGNLAEWLQNLHRGTVSTHPIRITPESTKVISDWILEEVEPLRGEINDRIYSHFARYLDLGYRLAAAQAASQWRSPERTIIASPKHAKAAVAMLEALKEAMCYLFSETVKTDERSFDDQMTELFRSRPKKWFSLTELDDTFPTYSMRRISSWCRAMNEDGKLSVKKIRAMDKKPGRRRISYRWG